jgi:hypothetical protein
MVAEQVKNQNKYYNTAVGYDGMGALDPTVFDDIRNHYVVSVFKDIEVNMLQHYKTVSYRRRFFEDDFWTDFAPYSARAAARGFVNCDKLISASERKIRATRISPMPASIQ